MCTMVVPAEYYENIAGFLTLADLQPQTLLLAEGVPATVWRPRPLREVPLDSVHELHAPEARAALEQKVPTAARLGPGTMLPARDGPGGHVRIW